MIIVHIWEVKPQNRDQCKDIGVEYVAIDFIFLQNLVDVEHQPIKASTLALQSPMLKDTGRWRNMNATAMGVHAVIRD